MRSKRLFQIFVLLAMLLSSVGSVQHASASTGPAPALDAVVIDRNLNYWDANYFGFVSSGIYENWKFEFTESHNFVVTVTKVTGDVVPLVILLDSNDIELARGTGSLTSTQPAGSYSFQVQPESGMGLYMLTLREVAAPSQPSASTVVTPASIYVGETATVTVDLNDVPAEGYTSAEFTCTYDANLIQVGAISLTDLFGMDPVMAATTPQDGSFILAVAASNGRKALGSGVAFVFIVEGLQAGQTAIECAARISKGDAVLTALPSTPASLNVLALEETPTPVETLTPTLTPTPVTEEPTATPVTEEPTPTPVTEEPTATPVTEEPTPTPVTEEPTSTPVTEEPTSTPVTEEPTSTPVTEEPTPTPVTEEPTPTPVESPTPTATPVPVDGTLTGQVLAGKAVTVSLYDAEDMLVTSVTANTDGTFSLTAPAGMYTVRATASGFLSAEGSVTLTAGETSTKPAITLLAGDIVNNDVIDQFDAMTIGMSYNTAIPAAADLNNDGIINVLDLELLARNYRAAGPLEW
ncbi:MAG: carboxypeptidase regulatory-like domain-containing protein [Anaerolineales bacterium]|nr:carboxypeptidase regulatory-like domain-containing protein [Anaerolineales bacterium]